MKLYHVSPEINLQSILDIGVSPDFARGQQLVSWWVHRSRVVWALAHVSRRYATPVDNLTVFSGNILAASCTKTRWTGVFRVNVTVGHVVNYHPTRFIDDEIAKEAGFWSTVED
jgi:hypothetical protein